MNFCNFLSKLFEFYSIFNDSNYKVLNSMIIQFFLLFKNIQRKKKGNYVNSDGPFKSRDYNRSFSSIYYYFNLLKNAFCNHKIKT